MGERDGRPLTSSAIVAVDYREVEPCRESPWRLEQLAGDRTRRDEWSEGAVASLLDAYEAKWALRNRAKLQGHDWEDVARAVTARAPPDAAKGRKTATQCKNKVESMKKRYRSESAASARSKWPLFASLDNLVRSCRPEPSAAGDQSGGRMPEPPLQPQVPAAGGDGGVAALRLPRSNGGVRVAQVSTRGKEHADEASKQAAACSMDLAHCSSKDRKSETGESSKKRRKRKAEYWDDGHELLTKSMVRFAEVALQIEQERMEAVREVEMMKAQAEAKIGEMELKRTEIIADTQLQIAGLLVTRRDHGNTNADSSSKTRRFVV